MTISNHQISSVIRTYMKNIKVKVGQTEKNHDDFLREDEANISKEAVKKMIYNRIGERVAEKLKKYDRE